MTLLSGDLPGDACDALDTVADALWELRQAFFYAERREGETQRHFDRRMRRGAHQAADRLSLLLHHFAYWTSGNDRNGLHADELGPRPRSPYRPRTAALHRFILDGELSRETLDRLRIRGRASMEEAAA